MARPRRSHDTRERLLDEGIKALIELGYNGAGVKEIVDRAGVPKGSFYNYFASKEQFAAEIIDRYSQALLQEMAQVLAPDLTDPISAVRTYFTGMVKAHQRAGVERGCLLPNLSAEIGGQCPQCRAPIARAFLAQRQLLSTALMRAQKLRQLRRDVDAGDLAGMLLDAWNGALIRMKAEGSTRPLKEFTKSCLPLTIAV